MPSLTEILNALYGSYLLARRDLNGYSFFDHSADGFWRSFTAIILVAPIFFLFANAEYQMAAEITEGTSVVFGDGPNYAGHMVGLVLQWVGYPVVMVFIAKALDLTQRYGTFIIAYNWSSALVMLVLFVPIALFMVGMVTAATAGLANLLLIFPVLYYRWFVARTALDVNASVAAGLVAVDFILSMLLLDAAKKFFG
jgi:hypothetical protein